MMAFHFRRIILKYFPQLMMLPSAVFYFVNDTSLRKPISNKFYCPWKINSAFETKIWWKNLRCRKTLSRQSIVITLEMILEIRSEILVNIFILFYFIFQNGQENRQKFNLHVQVATLRLERFWYHDRDLFALIIIHKHLCLLFTMHHGH